MKLDSVICVRLDAETLAGVLAVAMDHDWTISHAACYLIKQVLKEAPDESNA